VCPSPCLRNSIRPILLVTKKVQIYKPSYLCSEL
jgi:hypothetical protein